MSSRHIKDATTRASGRQYSSVSDMMKGEGLDSAVHAEFAAAQERVGLCQVLVEVRLRARLTQQELAARFNVSQGTISKWEAGPDSRLTVDTIARYAELADGQIMLLLGKRLNHVQSVKLHAFEIKRHLMALAALANEVQEMEGAIQGFFGEAFFNILTILSKCQQEMPSAAKGSGMNVRYLSENPATSGLSAQCRSETACSV